MKQNQALSYRSALYILIGIGLNLMGYYLRHSSSSLMRALGSLDVTRYNGVDWMGLRDAGSDISLFLTAVLTVGWSVHMVRGVKVESRSVRWALVAFRFSPLILVPMVWKSIRLPDLVAAYPASIAALWLGVSASMLAISGGVLASSILYQMIVSVWTRASSKGPATG